MNAPRSPHVFVGKDGHCVHCGFASDNMIHSAVHPEVQAEMRGDLPDSGVRTVFGDGLAMREADPNKPSMEGISPYAMVRLGMLLTKANKKYGDYRNWEKGMPVMRYVGGILRHAFAYIARDSSEDHLASIMWNAMCLMHHEEVGSLSGKTFTDLDDRPKWRGEK